MPYDAKIGPTSLAYVPLPCVDARIDEYGRFDCSSCTADPLSSCPFAHSCEEIMFHPCIYKTKLCFEYEKKGACKRYYCCLAHGQEELRPVQSWSISHLEGVCISPAGSFPPGIELLSDPDFYLRPLMSILMSSCTLELGQSFNVAQNRVKS
eukprot:GHVL01009954.1.p1 GENE.GHVL01009954.1~~GHVL01009954.1.p1  ORF type:complete len:152 (-),score=9.67 GHVL01009954.1:212-667(-)